MKKWITRECGHSEEVKMFGGKYDEQVERESRKLCYACWKAEQERKAQRIAEANDLPPLDGTEKQIQWAISIRNKILLAENAQIMIRNAKMILESNAAPEKKRAAETLMNIVSRTDAKFWIDAFGVNPNRTLADEVRVQYQKGGETMKEA